MPTKSDDADALTLEIRGRDLIRNRKREKQLRYQQHKARLCKSTSPSRAQRIQPVNVSEEVSTSALATPPRSKVFSSPYLQNRLSTTPKNQPSKAAEREWTPMKKDIANSKIFSPSKVRTKSQSPSRRKSFGEEEVQTARDDVTEEKTHSFPRRWSSTPGRRKSDILQQMRTKHLASKSKYPEENSLQISEQKSLEKIHAEETPVFSHDEKVSDSGKEFTDGTEEHPRGKKAAMYPDGMLSSTDVIEEQDTSCEVPIESSTAGNKPNNSGPTPEAPEKETVNRGELELFTPKPSFDMRSVVRYPPSPPAEPEQSRNDARDEDTRTDSDIAVYNPANVHLVRQVMRGADSITQDEKKDNEELDEGDGSWDVSNPVFAQAFNGATGQREDRTSRNAMDMFDTASWEETDATFSDVEIRFLDLMENAAAYEISTRFSFEQKQVLDDVRRNLQLAGGVDNSNISVFEHLWKAKSRLETPKEDEPLLFGGERRISVEEGIHTGRGETFRTNDLVGENHVRRPSIEDGEPLLVGVSSSDGGDDELNDTARISITERVQRYSAPVVEDDESSVEGETEEEADDDFSIQDGDHDHVEYCEQDNDDETQTVDLLNPLSERFMGRFVNDAPTFGAASTAAVNADAEEVTTNANGIGMEAFQFDSVPAVPNSTPVHLSFPPPPPPPGEKKKKKLRSKKKKSDNSASIPLLSPPPEDKLKKWEEEKMRVHVHLVEVRESREQANEKEVPGTPSASLFASGVAKKSSNPDSDSLIRKGTGKILIDRKLAEKAAFASTAASISFQHHLSGDRQTKLTTNDGGLRPWAANDIGTFPFARQNDQNDTEVSNHQLGNDEEFDSIDETALLHWLCKDVLDHDDIQCSGHNGSAKAIRLLLEKDENFNKMCKFMADTVNVATETLGEAASFDEVTLTTTFTDDDDTLATGDFSVRSKSTRSRAALAKQRPMLKPVVLSQESQKLSSSLLAANFVSFLYLTSKVAKVPSPFGSANPFLENIVTLSLQAQDAATKLGRGSDSSSSPQQMIFQHHQGCAKEILSFAYKVCRKNMHDLQDFKVDSWGCESKSVNVAGLVSAEKAVENSSKREESFTKCNGSNGGALEGASNVRPNDNDRAHSDFEVVDVGQKGDGVGSIQENQGASKRRVYIVPTGHPSPFEAAIWEAPRIVPAVLSFLGDPVAVCRTKMVNRYCQRLVSENEHTIMQDAVRLGGLGMNIRPAFWLWITLQRSRTERFSRAHLVSSPTAFKQLNEDGKEGKWQHVIERDVTRSFGNMPPHKTGARLRTDSIVRALVMFGQNRIMKRGVKGGGEEIPLPGVGPAKKQKDKRSRSTASPPPWESLPGNCDDSNSSATPTDTVSDWGPISPVASMAESSHMGNANAESVGEHEVLPKDDLALCGNLLTPEMKIDLQGKLRFILHSLATVHVDVGYCQGMDYVVAHLLRVLQDTIRWQAVQNDLPECMVTASDLPDFTGMKGKSLPELYEVVDKSLVVQESVFRVMDTFFSSYNLRHMYWPELRCLKTCCRVFERLIQIKLPVLADHFDHHDLSVGLFALGWFQTLFLYLPSMPSATVCHMWDIWLVERSFKIFFRVGTAILFLSQPVLLNHELEGMMTYLNTIPDATLLRPDILIPCALNIKVTNRMLQQIETEVTSKE